MEPEPRVIFTVGVGQQSVVYDGLVNVRYPVHPSRRITEGNMREYFDRMILLVHDFRTRNASEWQRMIPIDEMAIKITRTKINLNHCGPHSTTRFLSDEAWTTTNALEEVVANFRTNYIVGCFVDEDVASNDVLNALFVTHSQLADCYKRKILELAFNTWPVYDESTLTGGLVNSRSDLWGSEGLDMGNNQVASVIVLSCSTALEYLERKYYKIKSAKGFYSTVSAKKKEVVQNFRDHLSMRAIDLNSESPSKSKPLSMNDEESQEEEEEEQVSNTAPNRGTPNDRTRGNDDDELAVSGSQAIGNTIETITSRTKDEMEVHSNKVAPSPSQSPSRAPSEEDETLIRKSAH